MKTRKKTVKTTIKGRRRSSVIVVKKSPIRRNQRRNLIIPNKYSSLADYESPLRSLRDNGVVKPSTSQNQSVQVECIKQEQVQKIDCDQKSTCLPIPTKCNPTYSEINKREQILKDNSSSEPNNTTQGEMAESTTKAKSKSQKRTISTPIALHNKPNLKKRKLKKSPLSRFNESKEDNKLSESIIIIDDSLNDSTIALNKIEKINEIIKDTLTNVLGESSDYKPVSSTFTGKIEHTKSVVDTVTANEDKNSEPTVKLVSDSFEPLQCMPPKNMNNSKTVTSNQDVVEIDCNDTLMEMETDCNNTLMEMEAYHRAFNQSSDLPPSCPNFTDSVIVIDPDDDEDNTNSINTNTLPVEKTNDAAKPIEDCFVVWSSLSKPGTSTSRPNSTTTTESTTFNANPFYNNNVDIFKYDKILIDTRADINNLKLLNNENNKPKKSTFKSPKNAKGMKKPLLKTTINKGITPVKNSVRGTSRFVDKTTDSFLARAAAKAATKPALKPAPKVTSKPTKKTATTTVRKKSKTNGQLIFSSESKEDGENKKTKKKSMKGKLREIVIDGCNVAMAYNHNNVFSEKGIKLLIDYFTPRGHVVKVFIPQSRRSLRFPLLEKWFNDGIVVFTPSRKIGNKFITSYDDRYILEYATACGGIVVSQDQFRDLYAENPQYRDTIENRLLVPTFVGDYVMFPDDPLGRDGPTLTDFLKH